MSLLHIEESWGHPAGTLTLLTHQNIPLLPVPMTHRQLDWPHGKIKVGFAVITCGRGVSYTAPHTESGKNCRVNNPDVTPLVHRESDQPEAIGSLPEMGGVA